MEIHKKKCVCGHLLDAEDIYQQGKAEERAKVLDEFAKWCRVNDIQCRKKVDGQYIEFSVLEIVNRFNN